MDTCTFIFQRFLVVLYALGIITACSKTNDTQTGTQPRQIPTHQNPPEKLLSHLASPRDMQFLLLGEGFYLKDISNCAVCKISIPIKSKSPKISQGTLLISARQANRTTFPCSQNDVKNISRQLEPKNCTIIASSLDKENDLFKDTPSEADRLLPDQKTGLFSLKIESPIALGKQSTVNLNKSDWDALSLCNRSTRPQPIALHGDLELLFEHASTITGVITRVDFPMPEKIAKEVSFVGETKIENKILVRRIIDNVVEKDILYVQTDRGFDRVVKLLPPEHIHLKALRSKTVLDAGCGSGSFVLDLRSHGISAFGLDIVLNDKLKELDFFIEADMTDTKLNNSSFDVIYSIFTVFSNHYEGQDTSVVTKALKEFHRILKPKGVIRLISVNKSSITQSLKNNPGLSIQEYGEIKTIPYMVLQKTQ